MKALSFALFFVFFSVSSWGQDFCLSKDDYAAEVFCGGESYIATSMADINSYLINYGDNGFGAKNLIIDFALNGTVPEIHSPCLIELKKNTNVARLCLDGREGLSLSVNLEVRAWERIGLVSSAEINVNELTKIESGVVEIRSKNEMSLAQQISVRGWNSLKLQSNEGYLETDSQLLLESSFVTILAGGQVTFGNNTRINAYSKLNLNAVSEFSAGANAHFESQLLQIQAGSLVFGSQSLLKGYSRLELKSDAAQIEINQAARLEGSLLVLESAGETKLSDVDIYAWNSFDSISNAFRIGGGSYLESQMISFNAQGPSFIEANATLQAWNQVTLDSAPCDLSSSAVVNAPVKLGRCFETNPIPNLPPVAVATIQYEAGYSPLMVFLDGTSSTDSDGQIVSYSWTSDGIELLATASGNAVITGSGQKVITLTVTDDDGLSSTATVMVVFQDDSIAPIIATDLPDDLEFTTIYPAFLFEYEDLESGINPASVVIRLSGAVINQVATINSERALIQFSSAYPLPDGSYSVAVAVSDYAGNESQLTRHFTVNTGIATSTTIIGRVLDSNSNPLSGAQISFNNAPIVNKYRKAETDTDGRFIMPIASGGRYVVSVKKVGYAPQALVVEAGDLVESSLGDIRLLQLDPVVVDIDASVGGVIENTKGGRVQIPAGVLNEDVALSFTEYRSAREGFPGPLPELSQFTFAYDFNYVDRSLNGEIGISLSTEHIVDQNGVVGFPEGQELVTGFFDPDYGLWFDTGINFVVGEGLKNSNIPTGNVPEALPADINQPVVPDPESFPPAPPSRTPPPRRKSGDCGSEQIGCRINTDSGNLAVDHALSSIQVFDQSFGLEFSYNSQSAYPVLEVFQPMGNLSNRQMDFEVSLPGHTQKLTFENYNEGSELIIGGTFLGRDSQGKYLKTGVYPVDVRASNYFTGFFAWAAYFGAPAGFRIIRADANFEAPEPVKFSRTITSFVQYINDRNSAFGAGWTLNQLSRLHLGPTEKLLYTDGRGAALEYTRMGSGFGSRSQALKTQNQKAFSNELMFSSEKSGSYIADCASNQIYQMNAGFGAVALAGSGERGFAGDGGDALKAKLDCPTSVTKSIKGDYFFIDSGNKRIRKIDKHGVITTVAGNGKQTLGNNGDLATEVGIGTPKNLIIDELLVIYFTTDDDKIMMLDPRGKLHYFSADVENAFVPKSFGKIANLQISTDKRVLALDSEKKQILEIRPQNLSAYPELDLGDQKFLSDNEVQEVSDLKQFIFDKNNNRFFLLDDAGRLFVASNNGGYRAIEEFGVVENSLVSKKQILDKDSISPIDGIAYTKEMGLVYWTEGEVKFFGAADEAQDNTHFMTYVSGPTDPAILIETAQGFERIQKNGDKELFNHDGLLISRTNLENKNVFYRYTGETLREIEVPGAKKFLFDYDVRGYLTKVTDPAGRVSRFDIDPNGNLIRITNPDETIKAYDYDSDHLLIKEIKENGEEEEFVYLHGKIIQQVLPGGRTNDIKPALFVQNLQLNQIYHRGDTQANSIASFPSRSGDCASTYVFREYLVSETDCLGRTTRYVNTSADKRSQIISPEGRFIYQDFVQGDLLSYRSDSKGETFYFYDNSFGKVSKVRDELNFEMNYTYTANGKIETVRDQRNLTTSYEYDDYQMLKKITDSGGFEQSFDYDGEFNLLAVTNEIGAVTSYTRDLAGNINSVTDADGRVTQTSFDLKNRPVLILDAKGGETAFQYDSLGLMTALTDSLGRMTGFAYNDYNKVSQEIKPDSATKFYEYDQNERLVKIIQEDGSELHYVYNLAGELIEQHSLDETASFEYDDDGLMVLAENTSSRVELAYDEHGRQILEGQSILSEWKWHYDYNERGDLVTAEFKILNSAYASLSYGINERGEAVELIANVNGQILTWMRDLDSRNLPSRDRLGNGVTTNYAFDGARRVTMVENLLPNTNISSKFAYTYSLGGDVTKIEESLGGHGSLEPGFNIYEFDYDELHRLIVSGLDEENFSYDLVGNPSGTGVVVNLRNQLTENPEFVFEYDLRGNLIAKTEKRTQKVLSFKWDLWNRLSEVEIKNNGTQVSGRLTFAYDGFGRRIQKTFVDLINSNNSYDKRFIYDREDLVLEVTNNKITAFYVHAPGIDNPIGMLRDRNVNGSFEDDEIYYFTKDHLGSVREIVGLDGKIKQRQRYSAYGRTTREKNDSELSRLIDQPYGFTSREHDAETGMYYYRARYYDSSTGRFLSEDPIDFAGEDTNLYRYVANNPIRFTDPLGLLSFDENLARRREINTGVITQSSKFVAGTIVGSSFVQQASKVGLGVTVGEIIKNRGNVATLGRAGTIGNFATTALAKAVVVGASFAGGLEIGNRIGAYFDTKVDDNSSFLGVSPQTLSDIGFGSGVSNIDSCR